MIFYFSGTGNSKWIAEQLAEKTDDTAVDITTLNMPPELKDEKYVGLVFPVYAWAVPEPVRNFARQLAPNVGFAYGVCTCGAEAGLAMKQLSKIYPLQSTYSVVMPSNYIVGEDIEPQQTIRQKLKEAKQAVEQIADEITRHEPVNRVAEGGMAFLRSTLAGNGFDRFARTTKPFFAEDSCTGCGLCARICPSKTIRLAEGKPVWGETCYQCLACIHHCPQRAIQYGEKTKERGRYTIENYL